MRGGRIAGVGHPPSDLRLYDKEISPYPEAAGADCESAQQPIPKIVDPPVGNELPLFRQCLCNSWQTAENADRCLQLLLIRLESEGYRVRIMMPTITTADPMTFAVLIFSLNSKLARRTTNEMLVPANIG